MSSSLRQHGLQNTRPPCLSPLPGVYSNSCPLNRGCHTATSSSVVLFTSHLQSFPASGSLQMSQPFAFLCRSIAVSTSASVLPMNIQDWSPLRWTGWISLQSKGISRVSSNLHFKSINCSALSILYSLSHPYTTTGKTMALTRWNFAGKVVSLLFNMLSRLVITFLPRSNHLLIAWLQSPSTGILEPTKIKSVTVSPSVCHEVMRPDAMILVFWMLNCKPTFFTLLFHFHQEAL